MIGPLKRDLASCAIETYRITVYHKKLNMQSNMWLREWNCCAKIVFREKKAGSEL